METTTSVNPIKRGGGSKITLPGGVHIGTLKYLDLGQFKRYKADGMEDKLVFTFAIDTSEGEAHAKLFARPVCGEKSHLVQYLRQLAPAEFKPGFVDDPDALWELAHELVGREFMLTIQNEGGYNTIVSAMPNPASPSSKASKVSAPAPVAADDDIPF